MTNTPQQSQNAPRVDWDMIADQMEQQAAADGRDLTPEEKVKMREGIQQLSTVVDRFEETYLTKDGRSIGERDPEAIFAAVAEMAEQQAATSGNEFTPQQQAQMREGLNKVSEAVFHAQNTDWKAFAANAAKRSALSTGRRFFYNIVTSFSLYRNDPYKRRRMIYRLERGEEIGLFELLVGSRFGIGMVIRWIVTLLVLAGIAFYLWQQGLLPLIFNSGVMG